MLGTLENIHVMGNVIVVVIQLIGHQITSRSVNLTNDHNNRLRLIHVRRISQI